MSAAACGLGRRAAGAACTQVFTIGHWALDITYCHQHGAHMHTLHRLAHCLVVARLVAMLCAAICGGVAAAALLPLAC
jgi:hypothetical protein